MDLTYSVNISDVVAQRVQRSLTITSQMTRLIPKPQWFRSETFPACFYYSHEAFRRCVAVDMKSAHLHSFKYLSVTQFPLLIWLHVAYLKSR